MQGSRGSEHRAPHGPGGEDASAAASTVQRGEPESIPAPAGAPRRRYRHDRQGTWGRRGGHFPRLRDRYPANGSERAGSAQASASRCRPRMPPTISSGNRQDGRHRQQRQPMAAIATRRRPAPRRRAPSPPPARAPPAAARAGEFEDARHQRKDGNMAPKMITESPARPWIAPPPTQEGTEGSSGRPGKPAFAGRHGQRHPAIPTAWKCARFPSSWMRDLTVPAAGRAGPIWVRGRQSAAVHRRCSGGHLERRAGGGGAGPLVPASGAACLQAVRALVPIS